MLRITSSKCIATNKVFVRSFSKVPRYKEVQNLYNKKSSAYKPKIKQVKGLIHYPPPSAPSSTSEIPDLFMPDADPRKGLNLGDEHLDIQNAPALSTPVPKQYHLKPEDVEEIKKLRITEPYKYTRKALAKQFNVSEFTISLVSDQSQKRKEDMQGRLTYIKEHWSKGRKEARSDKTKREKHWYRDD